MKKFRYLFRENEDFESDAARTLKEKPNKEPLKTIKEVHPDVKFQKDMAAKERAKLQHMKSTEMRKKYEREKIQKEKEKMQERLNNMKESVKDKFDIGEYDQEGDMAKSDLRSIMSNAKRVHDMLEDSDNLPEWVQSKITKAEDYMSTVANYMEAEMNEEYESVPASKSLQKAHEDERKKRGLPDPDYYLKLRDQKKKEIEDMKKEEIELDENLMNLGGVSGKIAGGLVGAAVGAGIILHHVFPKKHEKTPIEHGIDKAYQNGDHKLYHSLKSHQHSELAKHYRKQAEHTTNNPDNYYKSDRKAGTRNPAAKKGEMKPSAKLNLQYHNRDAEHHEKRAAHYAEKEKSGAKINESFDVGQINEKNVPTSPEKWAQAKAQAKSKFDVYPSAYANGWAAKKYKAMGGGWKSVSEESELEEGYYKNREIERQETERLAKQPPFTPDKPKKQAVAGKKPEGYSTARHLARQAMKKYVKEEDTEKFYASSRKTQIVKNAAKNKNENKFEPDPVLSKLADKKDS